MRQVHQAAHIVLLIGTADDANPPHLLYKPLGARTAGEVSLPISAELHNIRIDAEAFRRPTIARADLPSRQRLPTGTARVAVVCGNELPHFMRKVGQEMEVVFEKQLKVARLASKGAVTSEKEREHAPSTLGWTYVVEWDLLVPQCVCNALPIAPVDGLVDGRPRQHPQHICDVASPATHERSDHHVQCVVAAHAHA